jgi:hypothetical protein
LRRNRSQGAPLEPPLPSAERPAVSRGPSIQVELNVNQLELNAKSAQRLSGSSTQLCKSGKTAGVVNIGSDA